MAGQSRPCRSEPGLNTSYPGLQPSTTGTVLLPARPRSPKDKAKVEVAVQIAQRWILARLRHVLCFSLAELNEHISRLLKDLNARPMRVYKKSRRELFEELDRPSLRPLPDVPYEFAEWKKVRVNLDYHVELSSHYYSVPYRLVHQAVELNLTQTCPSRRSTTASTSRFTSAASSEAASPPSWNTCRRVTRARPRSRRRRFSSGLVTSGPD